MMLPVLKVIFPKVQLAKVKISINKVHGSHLIEMRSLPTRFHRIHKTFD